MLCGVLRQMLTFEEGLWVQVLFFPVPKRDLLFPRGICVRKWNVLGSGFSGLSYRDPAQRELFPLF